jgi:hypothetical protein
MRNVTDKKSRDEFVANWYRTIDGWQSELRNDKR